MQNRLVIHTTFCLFSLLLLLTISSCTRDDEDLQPATFSKNADVFIDGFSGALQYRPFAGSKLDAFTVDSDTRYAGSAAMRFDVPNQGDPDGSFAGAIFPDAGGRNLTDYNALTFWAKATQAGTINEIGFGNDFGENRFMVTLANLQLSTNWKKYIIPIPDASKLVQENGMLWYSEGPEDGKGYSFWLDEVQFENLDDLGQARPKIFEGLDASVESFVSAGVPISGLQQTISLPSGAEQTMSVAPAYFTFTSSDPSVATVDDLGMVMVVGGGSATITASLGGIAAQGSLTVNSIGDFVFAPMPERDPADVISIFSDAYTNIPVDYYNGNWQFSTTQGGNNLQVQGDNLLSYSDLNFVGIQFVENVPTVDARTMTHLHLDVLISEELQEGDFLRVGLVDVGPDNVFGGGDDSGQELTFAPPILENRKWVSLDIPLSDFTGLVNRGNLAQVVFASDNTISAVLIDNLYLYRSDAAVGPSEPEMAAATPEQPTADVISIFSDAFDDVPIDTWRTDWSAADFADVMVAGNAVKKYSNLDFVGIEATSNPIDASAASFLHLDLWSPDFSFLGIKLVDFGEDGVFGGGDDSEHQINIEAPLQGEWISLDLAMADFTGLTNASSIAQMILVAQPSGNSTLYLDNVYFHGLGTSSEPLDAAPTPTADAKRVISLFSEPYTNAPVDSWRTDWSAATFEDILIAGDSVKKYSDLDFVGIETVVNTINASEMTHLHLDLWSPNVSQLGIKLVDFGDDGAFGGGDDAEHQIDFEALSLGEWVSLDIPLEDFTNLTTRGHLAQYILVAQPTGTSTIFLDNFYFYNQ